ncbi:PAS-domain containing protein [uncultured Roseobacter sp.]|uniref:PAS-domain containing protein n=1 Tax=uncultured Roseobacter sp. TaxID=114847 RepID=UPI00263795E6|nr:PAS-domain containing protein [uncultured Roseobacter sp.]
MIDPNDTPDVQVAKQTRIIDALIRRAGRQNGINRSAYQAFQSAIELQQQVAAQSRELESVRHETEQTRISLTQALSSMEEGFALFFDGQLGVCNELFRNLLPDVSDRLEPGLELETFFGLLAGSSQLVSVDGDLRAAGRRLVAGSETSAPISMVAEFVRDRWYQISAQVTAPHNIVILLTEITALMRRNRVEKEHLIDRQADYLNAVFENMSAGICCFSARNELMMHNGRFREILGLPMTVLQPGMPLQELLDFMHGRSMIAENDLLLVESWRQELSKRGFLRRRLGNRAQRVLDIHANELPDGGFLVEIKDVTLETRSTELLENRVMERTAELTRANANLTEQYDQLARIEEELRLAKERAEAAVSSKTRFLAGASHDLLQPINAAKLLISTLEETTRDTPFLPMVERLQGAFSSSEQILHSLLDISRLDSADADTVDPAAVSLGALMDGVRADQELLAAQKSVRLDVVPSTLVVRSDPVYLLRSIQNLVVNAIQYTEPGGRVLVGCRRKPGRAVLQVWDTGIGISRSDQERVFEEFARADSVMTQPGVGLGLSVVDRACKLLDHKLSLRSKPGRGSVFSIGMEVVSDVVPPQPARSRIERNDEVPLDYIVMVIENDPDVLFGTVRWLENWGASVLAASSVGEAMTLASELGMPPDIVLADYQLNDGETGVEAINALRQAFASNVPAILITADRGVARRRASVPRDVSVLTKPVNLTRLRPLMDWKIRLHVKSGQAAETELQTKVCDDSRASGHEV